VLEALGCSMTRVSQASAATREEKRSLSFEAPEVTSEMGAAGADGEA
jgi:hypothetical protein